MTFRIVWRNSPDAVKIWMQHKVKGRSLELSRKIFEGVVSRSPVYTGSLRASWNVAIGAPDMSRVQHKGTNPPLPPPRFPLTDVPIGSKVFITNSTPYLNRIEYEGWSNQAPQGMVRITLASLGLKGGSVRR